MMEFVEDARAQGKTIIFSSHHMSEVERLCDRMVVMHQGVIRGSGTPDSLKLETGQPTLEKAFLTLVEYEGAGI
jgi:sodium transport system ATP-binding protein